MLYYTVFVMNNDNVSYSDNSVTESSSKWDISSVCDIHFISIWRIMKLYLKKL